VKPLAWNSSRLLDDGTKDCDRARSTFDGEISVLHSKRLEAPNSYPIGYVSIIREIQRAYRGEIINPLDFCP